MLGLVAMSDVCKMDQNQPTTTQHKHERGSYLTKSM